MATSQPATLSPATEGIPSVTTDLCLEITRYSLYLFDFIFGVLMWGVTADKIICGSSLEICDVIIAFGVINMLILFAIIIWHSLRFFNKPFLPYLIEAIAFVVLAIIWLGLASGAVAKFEGDLGSPFRAAMAGGWLATFTHIGSAVLAFVQARSGGGEGKAVPAPMNPTVLAGANPQQPVQQPQGMHYGQEQNTQYSVPQTPQYAPMQPAYAPPTSPV